jgi:hypothetical protein
MPDLYFHIGLHKTGTSWLQAVFFPSLEGIEVHRTRSEKHIRALAGSEGRHLITHEAMGGRLASHKAPGTYRQCLLKGLELIRQVSLTPRVIVGFREQNAWINSAYCQKAKKEAVNPEHYLSTYAPNELCWQEVLSLVDKTATETFPFLYEELSSDPAALVEDMCRFLDVGPPADMHELLKKRVNLSPRTKFGQRVARPFFNLSYQFDRVGLRTKPLRELGARFGVRMDRYGTQPKEINLDVATAKLWREDWASLVRQVGKRRNRPLIGCLQ